MFSKDSEERKNARSVGSLLDMEKDIERRIRLSNVAFKKMKMYWFTNGSSNDLKIRLYNVFVKSILLCNCGTWGSSEKLMGKLDKAHRRHLRMMAGIFYPDRISNENLYKMFKEKPLSQDVEKRRWLLFGHVLRMHDETPAKIAIKIALDPSLKRRKGRPVYGFVASLKSDCEKFLQLELSKENLGKIKDTAQDKKIWISFF